MLVTGRNIIDSISIVYNCFNDTVLAVLSSSHDPYPNNFKVIFNGPSTQFNLDIDKLVELRIDIDRSVDYECN